MDKPHQYQEIWVLNTWMCSWKYTGFVSSLPWGSVCELQKGKKALSKYCTQHTLEPAGSLEEHLMLPGLTEQCQDGCKLVLGGRKTFCSEVLQLQSLGWFEFPWLISRNFTNGLNFCVPRTGRDFLVCQTAVCFSLFFYYFSLVFGSRAICHLLCLYSGGHWFIAQLQGRLPTGSS